MALFAHGHRSGYAGYVYHYFNSFMNVLVFKTSVKDTFTVRALKPSLDDLAGQGKWNFDLTDCDKILRIVSPTVKPEDAIQLMNQLGLQCAELEG